MSTRIQEGAQLLRTYLDDPSIAQEQKEQNISRKLDEIIGQIGLDPAEKNELAARALARKDLPAFVAKWMDAVAREVGVSTAQLREAIAQHLDPAAMEQVGKEALIQEMARRPLAQDVNADAIYAITGNTGPLAEPIISKWGSVNFTLPIKSEWRIVNLNAIDPRTDEPIELAKGKAPDGPPFSEESLREKIQVRFGEHANYMPGDTIAIYAKRPGQTEEGPPAIIELPEGRRPGAWTDSLTREPELKPDRTALDADGDLFHSTGKHAVPADATLRLFVNGIATDVTREAKLDGTFAFPIPHQYRGRDLSLALEIEHPTRPGRLPIRGSVADGAQGIDAIKSQLERHFQWNEDGARLDLEGLTPGFALHFDVNGQTHSFHASHEGKMEIRLPPVPDGAQVHVTSDPLTLFEPGGWAAAHTKQQLFQNLFEPNPKAANTGRNVAGKIDMTINVPADPLAERREQIDKAIGPTSHNNLQFAFQLFGPGSPAGELSEIREPFRLRTIFFGAVLGSMLRNNPEWKQQVTAWVNQLAQQAGLTPELIRDLNEALNICEAYKGRGLIEPGPDQNVRLYKTETGRSFITVAGGYNMLHPERSSPLHPQTNRTPDRYRLDIAGPDWLIRDGKTLSMNLTGMTPPPYNW